MLKIKFYIICFFLIFFNYSFCQSATIINFKLLGNISDIDTGRIILQYLSNNKVLIRDTSKIAHGHFIFEGGISANQPTNAFIFCDTKSVSVNDANFVEIFLEPRIMKIQLEYNNFKEAKLLNSKTQEIFDSLELIKKSIYVGLNPLIKMLSLIQDSLKDKYTNIFLQKKRDSLLKEFAFLRAQTDSIDINYILHNNDSYLSGYLLGYLTPRLSLDSVIYIQTNFTYRVRNSILDSNTRQYIVMSLLRKKRKKLSVGQPAILFSKRDINNNLISLASFSNKKYVLLDFWASWCVPCREEIPTLKKIYNKYHEKGLEIIAISLDSKRKNWIEAVKKDSTDIWYNILLSKIEQGSSYNVDSDLDKLYQVDILPTQILIGKDAKIIDFYNGDKGILNLEQKINAICNE